LPSILLRYENEIVRTEQLQGVFRSFAWSALDGKLILTGDHGRIVKLDDRQAVNVTSGTRQNLRGISVNRADGTILIVGNGGTVAQVDERGNAPRVSILGSQNLRAVSWNPDGTLAMIAGNAGALFTLSQNSPHSVDGGRANFRHISWQPNGNRALVTSNCFAEEFIPSPNLFSFDADSRLLTSLNEGRSDLIGVDWKPDGTIAIVVGYDVIWHNGVIAIYDGNSLSQIDFPNKRVYPVAVSWNPRDGSAAIVTATSQPGVGEGILYLWKKQELRTIFSSEEFFFNAVGWNREGTEVIALGSSATRTFNC
jgi:hypothetical protein